MRDLSQPTKRDISDDNDEIRNVSQPVKRDLADFDGRVLQQPTTRNVVDFSGRAISQPTNRSMVDFSGRTLQQPTARNIADDNDEIRDIDQFGIHRGYPYTYPFYYEGEATPRDLSDTS